MRDDLAAAGERVGGVIELVHMLKELFEHRCGGSVVSVDIASFVNEDLGHSSYVVDLGDGTAR